MSLTKVSYSMIDGAPVNVLDLGAVGDGVTDDTNAIQAAFDTLNSVYFPAGTYKVSDTLTIPVGNYNRLYFGDGRGTTAIVATGMTGKNAVELASNTDLYRFSMRDFSIAGDADSAMYLSTSQEIYQCLFQNMAFSSVAGSALYMANEFSNTFINCNAQSTNGHAFELFGGVGTSLYGCYAIQCGTNKAGYRIYRRAVLVGCNGVDSGDNWGSFGQSVVDDGTINIFEITLINCNLEDFNTNAIKIAYTGRLQCIGCNFVAKSSGTFNTLIYGNSVSNVSLYDESSIYTSKGATRTASSNFVVSGQITRSYSTGLFPDWYVTSTTTTYTPGAASTSFPAFATAAYNFPVLEFTTAFGFKRPKRDTWTANATNFNVSGLDSVSTANTVATNFDYANGYIIGQILTIVIADNNTTIRHNAALGGAFFNTGGVNIAATIGAVYMYVNNGTNWVQI